MIKGEYDEIKKIFKSKLLKGVSRVFIVLFITVMIGGCQAKEEKIETITLTSTSENIDINDQESFTYTLEPENIKIKKENIIFDDADMLALENIDDHSITLKTTNKTGNTSFYITANDISSNKISLDVVDKKKKRKS